MKNGTHRQRDDGASLIEILVAVVIVSFGLLGVAGLQTRTTKSNNDAYFYAKASLLGADIGERMRANSPGSRQGSYSRTQMNSAALRLAADCTLTTCTASQIANFDMYEWLQLRLRSELPNADATITSANSGGTWNPTRIDVFGNTQPIPSDVKIVIRWQAMTAGNCDQNGGTTNSDYSCYTATATLW